MPQPSYRVVFCIDRYSIDQIRNEHKDDTIKILRSIFGYEDGAEFVLNELDLEFVDPHTHENARLVSQNGLFTKSPSIDSHRHFQLASVDGWVSSVCSTIKPEVNILQAFVIEENSYDDRLECLLYLNAMNTNYKTLFPDPSGAARHCNLALEISGYQ